MNIVEIAGHLGADPEVRFSASGQKIVSMRIATTSRRQGKEETVWWRATIFGDRFDKMLSYMKKGSAIIVIGEMNPPHIWTDKEGKQHVQLELIVEMVRFSPFGKSDRSQQAQQEGGTSSYSQQQSSYGQQSTPAYGQQPMGRAPQQQFENSMGGYAEPAYGSTNAGNFESQFQSFSNNSNDEDQVPF